MGRNEKKEKTSTRERLIALKEVFEKLQYKQLGISMDELQNILRNEYELEPNRKTLYRDIEVINDMLDVSIEYNQNIKKYALVDRQKLRIEDIEIITNAIISSRFISKEETRSLIKRFHGKLGYKKQNIVGIEDRVKLHNEELYEVINQVDNAIGKNKKIKFDYHKLDSNMKPYCAMTDCIVTPLAHVWYEDFYFLLGNYKENKISHYRIDRIKNIEILEEKRKPIYKIIGQHNDFNTSEYISKIVGMSSGNEAVIEIKVKKDLLGKVYDKFGDNIKLIYSSKDWNVLRVTVINNKDLIRWVLMLGDGAELTYPEHIREDISSLINNMKKIYDKNSDI